MFLAREQHRIENVDEIIDEASRSFENRYYSA